MNETTNYYRLPQPATITNHPRILPFLTFFGVDVFNFEVGFRIDLFTGIVNVFKLQAKSAQVVLLFRICINLKYLVIIFGEESMDVVDM